MLGELKPKGPKHVGLAMKGSLSALVDSLVACTCSAGERGCLQGYLAHEETPNPLGPP